jgi:hypothetical protein
VKRSSGSVLCLLACAATYAGIDTCPPVGGADTHPTFDASNLKEGRFIYRTTLKGESLGETVIEIRRVDAQYLISMNAAEIKQGWKAKVEKSFVPVSASLTMRGKKGLYVMTLQYAGKNITGEEREAGVTRAVNVSAQGLVIDQRVDWASMMAATAPSGRSIAMRVFDPSTGLSDMLGKIGGLQAMSGAWGDVSALRLDYTICKREHVEEYTVYATNETPRYMLREDMPNGLVSELIRIEP